MTNSSETPAAPGCPAAAPHGEKAKFTLKRLIFPITGLAALIWFFIRVIPKPSRAAYPCQRAAFPLASSFVIWLTGIVGGTFIYKKLKKRFHSARPIAAILGGAALLAAVAWNLYFFPQQTTLAAFTPVMLDKTNVAIVQSSKSDVKQIDYTEIKQMVSDAVSQVGGIGSVVKNGDTVVLKPNLIVTNGLSAEANGVTTDWRVAKAVVELVRSVNPSGKVYVMEGAITDTATIFNYYKYTSGNIPGVDAFLPIEKDSGNWQDKNSSGVTLVNLPDGLLHNQYYLNRKYKEADVVISLPTMKTHWNAGFTGGIKNVGIGATPGNIYGRSSSDPARNNMVNHDTDDLHKWIHDFYKCRPVNLVIMDGLQGYQNGPFPYNASGANGNQMNMRLILAGKDAVAVDSIASLTVGYDPQTIGYLRYLNTSRLGNIDPSCINVSGKKVDEVRKYLAGTTTLGVTKITDKTAPQLSIGSVQTSGSKLSVPLTTDSETVKELVYIDGQLKEPFSASGMNSMTLDISGLSGSHQLTVEAYDRFLNRTTKSVQFSVDGTTSPETGYSAPRAAQAPVIDGIGSENCWQQAQWKDIKYVWLGNPPTASDFSGRFKLVWTPERLYYLVEITDDKLSAPNTTQFKNYYDNDCVELFIDEDHSGGNHQNNYNAFAYHIELDYDIIDNNTSGTQSLYNDHAKVLRTKNGNVYTWEIELKVFDDKYNEKVTTNVPVTLTKDKIMGFGVAYNDNDNGMTRENFMGSMDIPGTDKNVAWINASVFDTLKLVDSTPAVQKGDVNLDGRVDAIDLALLKAHLLQISKLTGDALSAADLDSDGTVDALDFMKLKQYLQQAQ
ncbi:endo-1,4-beta-xylanase Z precursor [Ruminiclostridium hungatei]|uniref:cellulase n=1 Tax=Ruminiclostridium hungatei TaxID=48256 RepID=A0A1V4SHC1_RUMHU|nr:sugar-binding protein [Ruminiclostridium hungatei]OPX42896.1 endo-1,4-beta-xylanase Z precursor [Ruminiclostridium hungatei]